MSINESKNETYSIHPIGYVRREGERTYIQVEKQYLPALKQLEHFSHMQVFCWFHECDDDGHRAVLKGMPPYKGAPETGVFASRSPERPNPIALSTAVFFHVDKKNGIIELAYIDAIDDTPVIDLKPYMPICDKAREVKVPEWIAHWPDHIPEEDFDPEEYGFLPE